MNRSNCKIPLWLLSMILLLLCISPGRSQSNPSIFLFDSFTDASGTLLENHTPDRGGTWTKLGTRSISINADGKAVGSNPQQSDYINTATPSSAEYIVFAVGQRSVSSTSGGVMLYCRHNGTNTWYRAFANIQGQTFSLAKSVNGTITTLASQSFTAYWTGTWVGIILQCSNSIKRAMLLGGFPGDPIVILESPDNSITAAGSAGISVTSTALLDSLAVVNGLPQLYDRFVDAASTPLENHTPIIGGTWSKITGSTLQISSGGNAVVSSDAGYGLYQNAATIPDKEGVIVFTKSSGAGSARAIALARKQTGDSAYLADLSYSVWPNGPHLWLRQAGTETFLQSGTAADAIGYGLFIVTVSKKYLEVQGSIFSTDDTLSGAGQVGIALSSNAEMNLIFAAFGTAAAPPAQPAPRPRRIVVIE